MTPPPTTVGSAPATAPITAHPGSAVPAPVGTQADAAAPGMPGTGAPASATALGSTHPAANASGQIREASSGAISATATVIKPVLKGLGNGGMGSAAKKLSPKMMRALREFEVAKDAFGGFCQHWHQELVDRQVNDASHVRWKMQNGVETGTYVAYGPIESCTCEQATNGVPVGNLTYNELDYTLTGKTIEQAKHAKPSVSVVPTREIFSWDKGKWYY